MEMLAQGRVYTASWGHVSLTKLSVTFSKSANCTNVSSPFSSAAQITANNRLSRGDLEDAGKVKTSL